MTDRAIVPVNLGCCPSEPRCALCPPPPTPPTEELVAALVASYAETERPDHGAFFGGPPPTDDQIAGLGGLPFAARVRPDLLTRSDLDRLVGRGCTGIELDAALVRGVGRRHTAALVRQIAERIGALGLRVGVVLAPGLPGSTFETNLADADAASAIADTARIHPVLVLRHAGLERRYRDGSYAPLDLPAAVAVCRAMMDRLEAAGVEVIRVGAQPGPDGLGHAVAGPVHSSLRELVEARRALDVLRGMLDGTPSGARIAIRCAPADETRTRGPLNQHVRTLRAEYGLSDVRVIADPELERGAWEVGLDGVTQGESE